MAYKNPVPIAFDTPKSKIVRLTFKFESYVSKEEAAEGIQRLLAEKHGGRIPTEWIELDKPTTFAAKGE